jgi:membrane complex biogenesis BtpA family protein
MAAEEGMVQGDAYATLRHRRSLGVEVKILADVLVKHAVPVGPQDLGQMAQETTYRGLADGLIVSGPVTGQPAEESDVAVARKAVPDGFLLVGSGINEANAARILAEADGAIVGTSLKRDGIVGNLIDPERVRRLAEIIHELGPYRAS